MPSSNKTQNLNLNIFDGTDNKLKREDVNSGNQKIDAAFKSLDRLIFSDLASVDDLAVTGGF